MFGPGLVGGLSGQTETFTVVAKSGNLSKICSFIPTPDGRQSKTSILSTNVDQKSLETELSIVILSPDWRQMTIENTVSIDF